MVAHNSTMKLRRLAGYGPIAAYVSAGALFIFFFILIFGTPISQNAPGIAVPMTVVYIFALWVWLAALTVVVLDLEWLELRPQHPPNVHQARARRQVARPLPRGVRGSPA